MNVRNRIATLSLLFFPLQFLRATVLAADYDLVNQPVVPVSAPATANRGGPPPGPRAEGPDRTGGLVDAHHAAHAAAETDHGRAPRRESRDGGGGVERTHGPKSNGAARGARITPQRRDCPPTRVCPPRPERRGGSRGGPHWPRRTTARPCRASGRLAHDADDLILPLRYSHASERCSGALGRRLHERRLLGIRGWREE